MNKMILNLRAHHKGRVRPYRGAANLLERVRGRGSWKTMRKGMIQSRFGAHTDGFLPSYLPGAAHFRTLGTSAGRFLVPASGCARWLGFEGG